MNTKEKNNEISSWDDLNCDMNLLRGIYSYGFEEPSKIQKKLYYQYSIKKILLHKLNQVQAKLVHLQLVLWDKWI